MCEAIRGNKSVGPYPANFLDGDLGPASRVDNLRMCRYPGAMEALMNQAVYNLWSLIIGGIGSVISLAVAIVILWYTVETQRLRRQSEQHTSLLRDQLAVSRRQTDLFAEQVLYATRPFVMCAIESFARGGSEFATGHPLRAVKAEYCGSLWNPTERFAHDLRVLVHDCSAGYFWSDEPPVLRRAGEPAGRETTNPIRGVRLRTTDQ